MRKPPAYLVRFGDGEDKDADDMQTALGLAAEGYDPSLSLPEILNSLGHIVGDPSEIISAIMRHPRFRRPESPN